MIHLTLTTGHVRQSSRSEVSYDAIAALRPLLASGERALPASPGYLLQVTIDGSALMATVRLGWHADTETQRVPLVTIGVAPDTTALYAFRQLYRGRVDAVREAPACIVDIHPTIALDPGAAEWLGDFERCLAWAWVERRRGSP